MDRSEAAFAEGPINTLAAIGPSSVRSLPWPSSGFPNLVCNTKLPVQIESGDKLSQYRTAIVRFALLFAMLFLGTASAAHAEREFGLRYSVNDTGSIKGIANANMSCPTATKGCPAARSAGLPSKADSSLNNDNWVMTWVDVDSDPGTFNSSSANQSLPANSTILYAALY